MKSITVKFAHEIIGTLSKPSKMPGLGYGLPASACHVGSKLRAVCGSTCEGCYAMKGNYIYGNVQASQHKRLDSLKVDRFEWIDCMVALIDKQLKPDIKGKRIRGKAYRKFFRWHDSGDLQSVDHLERIVAVCEQTPDVAHWLPTREKAIVLEWVRDGGIVPRNLTIRASAAMIDGKAPSWWPNTSTVHTAKGSRSDECGAYLTNGECGTCRDCWTDTDNISYPKH